MRAKDIIEVDIIAYGMQGEGVAKSDTFTVFIPDTVVGERVKVEVIEVKQNTVFAKIIKLLVPSANRITAPCPLFGKCGGCQIQHLDRQTEIEIKRQNIVQCFKKYAWLDIEPPNVITGEKRYGYRNKIALPIRNVSGKLAIGMFRQRSHKLVPIEACLLNDGSEKLLIDVIIRFANEYGLSAYDESTNTGLLRHLVARKLDKNLSIMLVINGQNLPHCDKLVDMLKQVYKFFTLAICPNTKHNNVILGESIIPIYGEQCLDVDINGLICSVHPLSFLQVNDEVRDMVYSHIVSSVKENSIVVDAYSGTGIMTAQLALTASHVYAIEIEPAAVQNAIQNAQKNALQHKITNILGDCKTELPMLLNKLKQQALDTTLVLDPPRQGVDKDVIDAIGENVSNILYLSCNPATLARDVALLINNGYQVNNMLAFDMFPCTGHVETLVCLARK